MNTKIKWTTKEDGGRKLPMAVNIKYCPIITFPDAAYSIENWSAEIFVQSQINQYESNAKLSYLSEDAPFELLRVGAEFELREGSRLVATGIIISEA